MSEEIEEILKKIIDKRVFESDYNNITSKLLYENITYDEAIENGIERVLKLNVF